MAQDKDKIELETPMGQEPIEESNLVPKIDKTKTSNLDDDLGTQFTKVQREDLTDGGETSLHTHAAATPAAHKASHQNGGSDEISVAGLSGELADDQPPKDHASAHQNGGGDEISVAGLSGELADDQPPKDHASAHEDGGGDEIDLTGLAGASIVKSFTAADDITNGKAVGILPSGFGSNAGKIIELSGNVSDNGATLGLFIGFAMETIASGDSGNVMCYGIKSGFSGLTIGSIYYIKDTADIIGYTTEQTSYDTDKVPGPWLQYFKPTKTLLMEVELYLKDSDTGDKQNVKIRRGTWDGLQITSANADAPSSFDWVTFSFGTGALVVPGETLVIEWDGSDASGATWGTDNSDVYADGYLANAGTPTTPDGDGCFKLREKDTDGEINTSAGTNEKKVGIAISATEILIIYDNT